MVIAGINLTKINVERTGQIKGKIDVNSKVVINKVTNAEIGIALKDRGIQVSFTFSSIYSPQVGKIEIEGNVLVLESEENAKKIIETWEKTKKLPPVLMQHVYASILRKCNIKALTMSEDVGLPSPIRLPQVKITKTQKPASVQQKKETKLQKK